MKLRLARIVLAVGGVLLLFVGGSVLLDTEAFAAANGVVLQGNASALSEYRAPGGMLVASALIMLCGVLRAGRAPLGLAVGAFVFGSYGVSRVISYLADGAPSQMLVQAATIELLLGAACLATLCWMHRGRGVATSPAYAD